MQRRQVLSALALLPLQQAFGQATSYPQRPIRLLVGFAAGGTPDAIARIVSQAASRTLGQPFIIENRLGANGIVAADVLARAAPDGYTLLLTTPSLVINPSIYKKLPYDLPRDLLPIVNVAIGDGYLLVVNPNIGVDSVKALVELGKRGKPISFSSPGIGNTLHLAAETLAERSGMPILHVPYKGAAPALNAVIAGEVQAMFIPPTTAVEQVKAGRVKALGFTGARRWPILPGVPTIAEAVPGFELNGGWHGLFAPAGTPAPIADKLAAAFTKAVADPAVKDFLIQGGYEPGGGTPAEYGRFVQSEGRRYAEIVKAAHIEPE